MSWAGRKGWLAGPGRGRRDGCSTASPAPADEVVRVVWQQRLAEERAQGAAHGRDLRAGAVHRRCACRAQPPARAGMQEQSTASPRSGRPHGGCGCRSQWARLACGSGVQGGMPVWAASPRRCGAGTPLALAPSCCGTPPPPAARLPGETPPRRPRPRRAHRHGVAQRPPPRLGTACPSAARSVSEAVRKRLLLCLHFEHGRGEVQTDSSTQLGRRKHGGAGAHSTQFALTHGRQSARGQLNATCSSHRNVRRKPHKPGQGACGHVASSGF